MNSIEKIELELKRDVNSAKFDADFKKLHVPTIERLIKFNGKYEILDCNCYFCSLGKK